MSLVEELTQTSAAKVDALRVRIRSSSDDDLGGYGGASYGRRVVERCYDGEAVGRLDSHGCGMDHPPDYWKSVDVHVLEYTQFTWS